MSYSQAIEYFSIGKYSEALDAYNSCIAKIKQNLQSSPQSQKIKCELFRLLLERSRLLLTIYDAQNPHIQIDSLTPWSSKMTPQHLDTALIPKQHSPSEVLVMVEEALQQCYDLGHIDDSTIYPSDFLNLSSPEPTILAEASPQMLFAVHKYLLLLTLQRILERFLEAHQELARVVSEFKSTSNDMDPIFPTNGSSPHQHHSQYSRILQLLLLTSSTSTGALLDKCRAILESVKSTPTTAPQKTDSSISSGPEGIQPWSDIRITAASWSQDYLRISEYTEQLHGYTQQLINIAISPSHKPIISFTVVSAFTFLFDSLLKAADAKDRTTALPTSNQHLVYATFMCQHGGVFQDVFDHLRYLTANTTKHKSDAGYQPTNTKRSQPPSPIDSFVLRPFNSQHNRSLCLALNIGCDSSGDISLSDTNINGALTLSTLLQPASLVLTYLHKYLQTHFPFMLAVVLPTKSHITSSCADADYEALFHIGVDTGCLYPFSLLYLTGNSPTAKTTPLPKLNLVNPVGDSTSTEHSLSSLLLRSLTTIISHISVSITLFSRQSPSTASSGFDVNHHRIPLLLSLTAAYQSLSCVSMERAEVYHVQSLSRQFIPLMTKCPASGGISKKEAEAVSESRNSCSRKFSLEDEKKDDPTDDELLSTQDEHDHSDSTVNQTSSLLRIDLQCHYLFEITSTMLLQPLTHSLVTSSPRVCDPSCLPISQSEFNDLHTRVTSESFCSIELLSGCRVVKSTGTARKTTRGGAVNDIAPLLDGRLLLKAYDSFYTQHEALLQVYHSLVDRRDDGPNQDINNPTQKCDAVVQSQFIGLFLPTMHPSRVPSIYTSVLQLLTQVYTAGLIRDYSPYYFQRYFISKVHGINDDITLFRDTLNQSNSTIHLLNTLPPSYASALAQANVLPYLHCADALYANTNGALSTDIMSISGFDHINAKATPTIDFMHLATTVMFTYAMHLSEICHQRSFRRPNTHGISVVRQKYQQSLLSVYLLEVSHTILRQAIEHGFLSQYIIACCTPFFLRHCANLPLNQDLQSLLTLCLQSHIHRQLNENSTMQSNGAIEANISYTNYPGKQLESITQQAPDGPQLFRLPDSIRPIYPQHQFTAEGDTEEVPEPLPLVRSGPRFLLPSETIGSSLVLLDSPGKSADLNRHWLGGLISYIHNSLIPTDIILADDHIDKTQGADGELVEIDSQALQQTTSTEQKGVSPDEKYIQVFAENNVISLTYDYLFGSSSLLALLHDDKQLERYFTSVHGNKGIEAYRTLVLQHMIDALTTLGLLTRLVPSAATAIIKLLPTRYQQASAPSCVKAVTYPLLAALIFFATQIETDEPAQSTEANPMFSSYSSYLCQLVKSISSDILAQLTQDISIKTLIISQGIDPLQLLSAPDDYLLHFDPCGHLTSKQPTKIPKTSYFENVYAQLSSSAMAFSTPLYHAVNVSSPKTNQLMIPSCSDNKDGQPYWSNNSLLRYTAKSLPEHEDLIQYQDDNNHTVARQREVYSSQFPLHSLLSAGILVASQAHSITKSEAELLVETATHLLAHLWNQMLYLYEFDCELDVSSGVWNYFNDPSHVQLVQLGPDGLHADPIEAYLAAAVRSNKSLFNQFPRTSTAQYLYHPTIQIIACHFRQIVESLMYLCVDIKVKQAVAKFKLHTLLHAFCGCIGYHNPSYLSDATPPPRSKPSQTLEKQRQVTFQQITTCYGVTPQSHPVADYDAAVGKLEGPTTGDKNSSNNPLQSHFTQLMVPHLSKKNTTSYLSLTTASNINTHLGECLLRDSSITLAMLQLLSHLSLSREDITRDEAQSQTSEQIQALKMAASKGLQQQQKRVSSNLTQLYGSEQEMFSVQMIVCGVVMDCIYQLKCAYQYSFITQLPSHSQSVVIKSTFPLQQRQQLESQHAYTHFTIHNPYHSHSSSTTRSVFNRLISSDEHHETATDQRFVSPTQLRMLSAKYSNNILLPIPVLTMMTQIARAYASATIGNDALLKRFKLSLAVEYNVIQLVLDISSQSNVIVNEMIRRDEEYIATTSSSSADSSSNETKKRTNTIYPQRYYIAYKDHSPCVFDYEAPSGERANSQSELTVDQVKNTTKMYTLWCALTLSRLCMHIPPFVLRDEHYPRVLPLLLSTATDITISTHELTIFECITALTNLMVRKTQFTFEFCMNEKIVQKCLDLLTNNDNLEVLRSIFELLCNLTPMGFVAEYILDHISTLDVVMNATKREGKGQNDVVITNSGVLLLRLLFTYSIGDTNLPLRTACLGCLAMLASTSPFIALCIANTPVSYSPDEPSPAGAEPKGTSQPKEVTGAMITYLLMSLPQQPDEDPKSQRSAGSPTLTFTDVRIRCKALISHIQRAADLHKTTKNIPREEWPDEL